MSLGFSGHQLVKSWPISVSYFHSLICSSAPPHPGTRSVFSANPRWQQLGLGLATPPPPAPASFWKRSNIIKALSDTFTVVYGRLIVPVK